MRVGTGFVRNRHGFDEVLLEFRLHRGLDLLHLLHHPGDLGPGFHVEQGDPGPCSRCVPGRPDLGQVAIGNHPQDHGVFDVDMAAEGPRQGDAVELVDLEMVHEQPRPGIERRLGQLDRPDVVLGDPQHRLARGRPS